MKDPNRQRLPDAPGSQGKEIFEIKPVILGGSPTDPANKTILDREDHVKAVTFWNRIIAGLRKQQAANR